MRAALVVAVVGVACLGANRAVHEFSALARDDSPPGWMPGWIHGAASILPWSVRPSIAANAPATAPDDAAVMHDLNRAADIILNYRPELDKPGELRDLLRSIADTMAGGPAIGALRRMRARSDEIARLDRKLALDTLEGKQSAALEEQRARARADYLRAGSAFVAALNGLGVPIAAEDAEALALSANGDDRVALLAAESYIDGLVARLRKTAEAHPENTELLSRYYLISSALCAIVEIVQTEARQRIVTVYLPRLDEIRNTVIQLEGDARALSTTASAGAGDALKHNLEVTAAALALIERYRQFLRGQADELGDAIARSQAAYAVSANTARVYRVGQNLLDLVRTGRTEISSALQLKAPPIFPLNAEQWRKQFEAVSRQLRGSSS